MRRLWIAILLVLAFVPVASAGENIVPVFLWLPNQVLVKNAPWFRLNVPGDQIPPGTVGIVGWKVWYYDTGMLGYYSELRVWHDGGTPHLLDSLAWSVDPRAAALNGGHVAIDRPAVMLPVPGHKMDPDDLLFVEMRCIPLPSKGKCSLEAGVTFYLRVVDP